MPSGLVFWYSRLGNHATFLRRGWLELAMGVGGGSQGARKETPDLTGAGTGFERGGEWVCTHPRVLGCHHLLGVASLDLNG